MACCTDIVTGAAANVLPSVLKRVVQEVKMVISLPQSFRDMEVQVGRLKVLVNDINVELAQGQMNPKRIVKAWLDKAGEAIVSSESIVRDYEQRRRCLSWCPNCFSLYRISKDIRDWKATAAQLHSEKDSDFPPSGEYGDSNPPAQLQILTPEAGFVGNGIKSAVSEVEERLTEDRNTRIIGVYGMGGVGKTALLQTINNSLKQNFPDKSDLEGRKHRLWSYLNNKRFLLLLDDMWKSLDLHNLGVSLNESGSKIVLTTRNKQVCTSMGAKDPIKVVPLSEEEGWRLFSRRAFCNGNVSQEIEVIARQIAGECKGLPLAINVVAAAMADKVYPYQWEHVLLQMQTVDKTFYELHIEMDEKVFRHLKWSYNVLPDYLKTCFVYFAAYPEDTEIYCEDVIDIWIAEGLVPKSSGDSYLPDTAHSFIDFLRDRCLIEVVQTDEVGRVRSVKIHDVIRDLAILIAEKEHRCYFKAGQGVSHFPSETDSGGCARMSLMRSRDLHSLPTTFRCSSLSVLLLRGNEDIKEVPGSFLNELPLLRVLDLSRTGITSLPPSIGNLKHLSSLQLEATLISELPESIGDLKELQFLNLKSCRELRCLPERMRELKRLRALDVRFCHSLKHLPRGISELVSLERLSMPGSGIALNFEEEEEEEEADAERKNACLKDMQSLSSLRVLRVEMKSAVKEGVIGNWSKMRHLLLDCEDSIGQDYLPQDMQAMKDLESFSLWGCVVERLPCWITQFRKLACLSLIGSNQLKELPTELPSLRTLWIHGCSTLEALELGMGFPMLQELTLYNLKSLECVGPVGAASGSGGLGQGASPLPPMLKSLCVYLCPKLKRLRGGAASGSGGLGQGASPLPPMLKSLCVYLCPKLKRLRGGWDELNHLVQIKGGSEWWDAIEWDNPTMKTSLDSKFIRS